MRRLTTCLIAVLTALASVGCGGTEPGPGEPDGTTGTTAPATGSATSPPATPAPSPTAEPETVVAGSVYFLRGEKLAPARRDLAGPAVAASAVRALLAGPTEAERAAGMTSTIPAGTELRGVNLVAGTATVDLSGRFDTGGGTLSMTSRLALVVFTLTQFATIDRVEFRMDGVPVRVFGGEGIVLDHPQTRADYEDLAPLVLVEAPAFGTTVTSPLRVYGTANVFEAEFFLQLADSTGKTLLDQRVMASSGTGTRGTFDTTLRFTVSTPGQGKLIAWYASPKDGSRVVVSETLITLRS